jgi:hypothetical protein
MFVFPWWLVVGDVSVIHQAFGSCAQAAAWLPGWAAARRDAAKERAYRCVSCGPTFVPRSVESFRRLGAVVASFLGGPRDAGRRPWPLLGRPHQGALRELGVALCHGNASLDCSGLYALTPVSGRAPLRGLSCLSAEMVRGCPRLPVGRSPWLTCVGVPGACLLWICLVWLAFICVWPRLFAFRRPCC